MKNYKGKLGLRGLRQTTLKPASSVIQSALKKKIQLHGGQIGSSYGGKRLHRKMLPNHFSLINTRFTALSHTVAHRLPDVMLGVTET